MIGNPPPDKGLGQHIDQHGQGGEQGGGRDAQPQKVTQINGQVGIKESPPKHGQEFKRGETDEAFCGAG